MRWRSFWGASDGLLVGVSAAALWQRRCDWPSVRLQGGREAVIVTILCDSADKYMSERFWQEGTVMLKLSYADYEALRAHGEETYPHECCGVLLGKSEAGRQSRAGRSCGPGNTRTDSAHNRYNIAPEELIRIQRQARKLGLDIVGFYHSHPDHPAQWSTTDFAEAHWVGCSYVITSVEQGKAEVTNSFLLTGTGEDDKKFIDEAVEIEMARQQRSESAGEQSMKIHIPTPLRTYTGGKETVNVPGTTVGERAGSS